MQYLLQDLRYAIRIQRKAPGLTIVAVAALALGIGASTAIFSVVDTVLFRSLPYDSPDQLVWIWEENPVSDIKQEPVSLPDFVDWRDQNQSFVDMAAFVPWLPILTSEGEPERVHGGLVSATLFSVLHAEAMLGRTFLPEEDQPGQNGVVVLSYDMWQRRFGSSNDTVGKTILLNNKPYLVVGVMPASFQYPTPDSRKAAELWIPLGMKTSPERRRDDFLDVIARLKPSVSLQQARAEMETIAARLEQQYSETNSGWRVTIIPLHERFVGKVRPALLVLLSAVSFLLLIACANVANLLMVRATVRQREIAIRKALGAGRARLVQQLLTESLLVGMVGGAFGLLLAWLGIKALIAFSPGDIPRIDEAKLDLRVLAFALVLSLLTGVLFGLAPAWQGSSVDLTQSLKEGGRGSTESKRSRWMRSLLVVSEVALAFTLLIGSGLMLKSFMRLQRVDPGVNPDSLLTLEVALPRAKYRAPYQIVSFIREVLEAIRSAPGVQDVAAVTKVPLSGQIPISDFGIEGQPPLPAGQINDAESEVISPTYFQSMGIPLLRGRFFTEHDTADTTPVVIINEVMAQRYWPGEDPIGKRITLDESGHVWLTIVGIVGNVHQAGLDLQPYSQIYQVYTQNPSPVTALIVRSPGDPMRLASTVRRQMMTVDKDQPLYNVRTMKDILSTSVARPRFNTQLISLLTAVALILTAVGIYGLISYSVSQRFHEIGIRIALGAHKNHILQMIIAQGLKLATIGIVIGLVLALILTRLMATLLYNVSATDTLTFVAVPVMIAVIVLAACYFPARRATKIDPMMAIRYE